MQFHGIKVIVPLINVITIVTSQVPGQSQCQIRFLQSAALCLQNASLNINNVQYLASNGTSGQAPQENIQTFRSRVCAIKNQLDVCGQSASQAVINNTLCVNMAERQSVLAQFQATFGGLDTNCAHACRYTLLDEIRQCYSFVNLQPDMVSDMALLRSAIFGQNYDQVHQFCLKRQSFVQCLRQKVLLCPDSPRVLAQSGLDLTSFERGIDLLCSNIRLYLTGINCFQNPIPEVRMCFQTLNRKMQNLQVFAPQPTADQISLGHFCNIRLEHVDCETGAWARHQYQSCDRVVTGMRNELECRLLPDQCMATFPQLVMNVCNPLNYFAEERWRYNSAYKPPFSMVVLITAMIIAEASGVHTTK